jgi:hypothetical protein
MDDYATVGGRWNRMDPTRGRVGSAFSDPGVSHEQIMHGGTLYGEDSVMPAHEGNGPWEMDQNGFEQWESSSEELPFELDDPSPRPDLEAYRPGRTNGVIMLGH